MGLRVKKLWTGLLTGSFPLHLCTSESAWLQKCFYNWKGFTLKEHYRNAVLNGINLKGWVLRIKKWFMPSMHMYIDQLMDTCRKLGKHKRSTRIALQTSQVYIELNMPTAKAMNQFFYNTAIITTKTGFIWTYEILQPKCNCTHH